MGPQPLFAFRTPFPAFTRPQADKADFRRSTARVRLALGVYAALAWPCAAPAFAQTPMEAAAQGGREPSRSTSLQTERPEGFDDLLEARETPLQLYVDGKLQGQAPVLLSPGVARFADPAALISKLPPLKDAARVMAALRAELPTNAGLSCSPSPTAGCGRLNPDVVGIILSRDSGRIDLFLAPEVRGEARPFLPDPEPGPPTLAGAMGLQYSLASDRIDLTLNPRFVLGLGRRHITADSTFSGQRSSLDRAYFRQVGNRSAFSVGLIQPSSYNFAFFERLVGAQVASSTEARIERNSIADTPLIIDAPLSGRVDILRDGVLLDTQRIAPGRVTLDTSRLPGGSFPLTLRIKDASGEREERRIFTRASGLPGYGDAEWFVEGGWNTGLRGADAGFLPSLLSPTLRAGYRLRAGSQLGLFVRGEGAEKRQLAELGAIYLQGDWRTSVTLAGTAQGQFGAQANVSGNSKTFSWSLDARHISGPERPPAASFDPEVGLGRPSTSLSAFGGYNSGNFSLTSGLQWQRDGPGQESFTILPNLRWTFRQAGGQRWDLDASGSYSRTSWTVRVGIRLALFGGTSSKTLYAGGEGRKSNGGVLSRRLVSGDWSRSLDTDLGPLQLRAGVSQQFDRLSGRLGANLRYTYADLSADAQIEEQLSSSSLFGRVQTSFGYAEKRLALGGGDFTGAGIAVEAPDAASDVRYQLRAPGGTRTSIKGSYPVFVGAPPFSMGEVGVDALGGVASFDTRREPAVFFPGTVKRLVRRSIRIILVYGQLVDEAGRPLANASLSGKGGLGETDDQGRFQIELGAEGDLVAELGDGGRCGAKVTGLAASTAIFVNVGQMVCRPVQP